MGLEWFFVAACLLYSGAILSHVFIGRFRPWIVAAFGTGLACDTLGTVLLCATVAGAWRPTFHMITGTASLVIMALHFVWALLAMRRGQRSEAFFRRWSIPAWLLWLSSFVSGAFLH